MTASGLHTPPAIEPGARLAFVETARDAQLVLDSWARLRLDAVVALEPEGAWALHTARRPYLTLEDAYDAGKICALADSIVERQQAWADEVDRWLHMRLPMFAQHDFRPARLHLYWLKILFDSLAIRVFPTRWALEKWQPSWIWHPGQESCQGEFGWDLTFRKSLYPSVLRVVCQKLGVQAVVAPDASEKHSAPNASGAPHWGARRGLAWVMERPTMLRMLLHTALRPADSGQLVLGHGYDLDPVWREALLDSVSVVSWRNVLATAMKAADRADGAIVHSLSSLWNDAVSETSLLEGAVVEGCDLRSFAEPRVRFWWECLIPQQWQAFVAVREHWSEKEVRAVAVSGLGDHIERAAFAAMRSTGALAYIYQHGGFVGACECPPWDCNDLWLADAELTYGAGTTAYFTDRRNRYRDARAVPITVGSSRLDGWRGSVRRRQRPSKRRMVLLVPNLIPRNNRYFDAGTAPDVAESEVQLAMVGIASEFREYDFVLKAFPYPDQQHTPAVESAGRPGSNCRIVLTKPLPRLLAEADLIVMSFASTALLEALMTDRHILVLVDPTFVRMRPSAREVLKRRAHVATNPVDFVEQYRRLLQNGEFGPISNPDDTFLREYGTHLNDGRSAKRALKAISSSNRDEYASLISAPISVRSESCP